MTLKQQKERKLKILSLILMCDFLLYKKDPPKTIPDIVNRTVNTSYWVSQILIVSSQPLPPNYIKGCKEFKSGLAIVGD